MNSTDSVTEPSTATTDVTAGGTEQALGNPEITIGNTEDFVIIGPSGQTIDDQIAISGGAGGIVRASEATDEGAKHNECDGYDK